MKTNHKYSNRFRILKGGKISLIISALLGSVTLCFAAPSAGVVTSGTASINQSGNTTNINQSTSKASINWNKFNIASHETVNFNQPNVNSITLNRVIGSERSIIDGALNANGQVWILNSNGVLFGKDASINTSGILATTKDISDANFQSGNYSFSGDSTESVINQGTIKVKNNAYVIFASNEAKNSGVIEAIKGRVQLTGADEYTINLNGNSIVDLVVDKGILDALVENSGTILANGGEIFLTTNAVNELLRGVVNNTGIIEANSLDGISGHVELYAHGGTANIDGNIKAKGGFVETSGKELSVASTTSIETSKWLLNSQSNIIINSGNAIANIIQNALVSADVEIQTGYISIWDDIIWSEATKLTLTADSTIELVSTIENTNTTYGGVYFNAPTVSFKILVPPPLDEGKVIIHNAHQLQWINTALDGIYELGSNIDASDTRNWNAGSGFSPIGSGIDHMPFTGILDGKGYVIDGLYINGSSNYIAPFSYITGTIQNIGSINTSISSSGNFTGGLVGASTGTISNSYVQGDITGKDTSGGLVGSNGGTISNSYFQGDITGDTYSGGLAGDNGGTVSNSYSQGTVTATNTYGRAGGLVGANRNHGSINNSYSSAKVSAYESGGLIAFDNYLGTISNSYWDIDTTGQTFVGGGLGTKTNIKGLSTEEFAIQSNFSSWDSSIWQIPTADSSVQGYGFYRPYLKNVTKKEHKEIASTLFESGFGSKASPYIITNVNQLQNINYDTHTQKSVYNLANNIDASDTSNWNVGDHDNNAGTADEAMGFIPIGEFNGIFDGVGHTINDLYINRPLQDNVGLFGITHYGFTSYAPSIFNLGLVGVDIIGQNNVGSFIGDVKFSTFLENSFATGKIQGNNYVGGLIGQATKLGNSYPIKNTYTDVYVKGNSYLGGLFGGIYFDSSSSMPNNIANSYAKGKVEGNSHSGALIGIKASEVTLSNLYWDKDTTGVTTAFGSGSSTEIKEIDSTNAFDEITYAGFDFTNDWIIYEGHTRPLLRTFMTELTVKANDATRTYDGTTYNGSEGVTYSIPTYDSSLVNGTLNYTSSGDLKNAGTATIGIDGLYSSQQGYIISYDTGTLTTNKKELLANFSVKDKVYDGTTSANASLDGGLSGLVSGDNVSLDSFLASFNDKNVGDNKPISISNISLSGSGSSNYTIASSNSSTASITPKELSATFNGNDKVYDGTTTANVEAVLEGLISGDDITVSQSALFEDKNAGENKTINITDISLSGDDMRNYIIETNDSTSTTATINKALATVTVDNKEVVYNGETHTIDNYTVSGLVNNEDKSVIDSITLQGEGKDAGTHIISALGEDNNYNFEFIDGTLTITPKAINVIFTANNKEYDGSTTAIANGSLSGVIQGDDIKATYSSANFEDEKPANDKNVYIEGISLSGSDSQNYTLIEDSFITTANINNSLGDIISSIVNGANLQSIINNINFNNQAIDSTNIVTIQNIITTLLQQGETSIPIIKGIVLKVLDGGINMPYGTKRELILDDNSNSNNDEDEDKKGNSI
ncbi:YDG domain-containing protein [Campylobacterota bacterium DY0563]